MTGRPTYHPNRNKLSGGKPIARVILCLSIVLIWSISINVSFHRFHDEKGLSFLFNARGSKGSHPSSDTDATNRNCIVSDRVVNHDAKIREKKFPFLLDINHTLCTFHKMDRVCHRPETVPTFPIIYVTAKFRFNENSWTHELYNAGCFALRSQVFRNDELWVFHDEFPPFVKNHPAYDRHRRFLTISSDESSRGAGYWFWKPLITLRMLQSENLPWNSFLVYADVDRWEVPSFVGQLIEAMVVRRHNFAIQQWDNTPEREWSKGDLFQHFGAYHDTAILNSNQYSASFYVVQKTPSTIEFFHRFARLMENYHLVSDETSILPDHKDFNENRHDQSMLSMLLKVHFKDGWGSKTEWVLDENMVYPSDEWDFNSKLRLNTFDLTQDGSRHTNTQIDQRADFSLK